MLNVIDLIFSLSWFLRYLMNISGYIEYDQCSIIYDRHKLTKEAFLFIALETYKSGTFSIDYAT